MCSGLKEIKVETSSDISPRRASRRSFEDRSSTADLGDDEVPAYASDLTDAMVIVWTEIGFDDVVSRRLFFPARISSSSSDLP